MLSSSAGKYDRSGKRSSYWAFGSLQRMEEQFEMCVFLFCFVLIY